MIAFVVVHGVAGVHVEVRRERFRLRWATIRHVKWFEHMTAVRYKYGERPNRSLGIQCTYASTLRACLIHIILSQRYSHCFLYLRLGAGGAVFNAYWDGDGWSFSSSSAVCLNFSRISFSSLVPWNALPVPTLFLSYFATRQDRCGRDLGERRSRS